MSLGKVRPSDVTHRMLATTLALSPLLLVESHARGNAWIIALLSGVALAMAFAQIARHTLREPIAAWLDVFVLAMLIALLLPRDGNWMSACLAVAIAMLVGRQAFGGLGQAIFHPAMVGLALVGCLAYRSAEPCRLVSLGRTRGMARCWIPVASRVGGVARASVLFHRRCDCARCAAARQRLAVDGRAWDCE